MTFKLMPGDFIATSDVPENKRQDVIDAFVAYGCSQGLIELKDFNDTSWDTLVWDETEQENGALNIVHFKRWRHLCKRRVTLSQILGDECEIYGCDRNGVRGNENIIDGKITCDDCIQKVANSANCSWDDVGPELLVACEKYQMAISKVLSEGCVEPDKWFEDILSSQNNGASAIRKAKEIMK